MNAATGPATYAPVRSLMLYLAEQCNLRCTYCFVDKKARYMTSDTARKAVDFFLSRNISGAEDDIWITFFGGEPFTELDLVEEVVAYSERYRPNVYKKITFSTTTNGTVASPRVERIIRDSQMHLLISMDGRRGASRYRPFVSGRSSYPLVARNLRKLAQWSPDAVVRMTFHPGALDLVGNVQEALELGAPSVALCPVNEADWTGHEEQLDASYQALAEWCIAEARQHHIVPLEVTHHLLRLYHLHQQGAPRPQRPCGVGTNVLSVDPEGNVMPCHRFLYRPQDWLGTVSEPVLSEARQQYVHFSSHDMLGCDTCIAAPVCGGGCRVVAMNAGLGLHGAHPGYCLTARAHTRAAIRIYHTLMNEDNFLFARTVAKPRGQSGAISELVMR